MEFITSSRGVSNCVNDYFSYTKEAEKSNRVRWECLQQHGLLCNGAITTSLQCDDLHVTVPHCHTTAAEAVEADKVKLKVQTHVRYICARLGQVLAAGITSAAGEVYVKLGRTDSTRRYLWRPKCGILLAEPATTGGGLMSGRVHVQESYVHLLSYWTA